MIRHAAVLARELENSDMVVHIKGDVLGCEGGEESKSLLSVDINTTKNTTILPNILSNLTHILPVKLETLALSSLKLHAQHHNFDATQSASALDSYHSLREVSLSNCDYSFVKLFAASNKALPCPSLQKVVIQGEVGIHSLMHVVTSRWGVPGIRPLLHLEIVDCAEITQEWAIELKEYVGRVCVNGVEVRGRAKKAA